MGDNTSRRQPVPARAEPIPAAIDAIEQTPPASPANAGASSGTTPTDDDGQPSYVEGATEARALTAFAEYQPNDLVTGTAAEITALMLAGNVDPHPDAVSYARSLRA